MKCPAPCKNLLLLVLHFVPCESVFPYTINVMDALIFSADGDRRLYVRAAPPGGENQGHFGALQAAIGTDPVEVFLTPTGFIIPLDTAVSGQNAAVEVEVEPYVEPEEVTNAEFMRPGPPFPGSNMHHAELLTHMFRNAEVPPADRDSAGRFRLNGPINSGLPAFTALNTLTIDSLESFDLAACGGAPAADYYFLPPHININHSIPHGHGSNIGLSLRRIGNSLEINHRFTPRPARLLQSPRARVIVLTARQLEEKKAKADIYRASLIESWSQFFFRYLSLCRDFCSAVGQCLESLDNAFGRTYNRKGKGWHLINKYH